MTDSLCVHHSTKPSHSLLTLISNVPTSHPQTKLESRRGGEKKETDREVGGGGRREGMRLIEEKVGEIRYAQWGVGGGVVVRV